MPGTNGRAIPPEAIAYLDALEAARRRLASDFGPSFSVREDQQRERLARAMAERATRLEGRLLAGVAA